MSPYLKVGDSAISFGKRKQETERQEGETFIRGLKLKSDLVRNEDIKDSEDIANDDIFYAANKRCEELKNKIPHFEMKHKIEFSSWLSSNQTSGTKRKEVEAAEEVVQQLHLNLHNMTNIADNIQTVVETGQEDIRRVSISGLLTTDFGLEEAELSVSMSYVNISRAPAAS